MPMRERLTQGCAVTLVAATLAISRSSLYCKGEHHTCAPAKWFKVRRKAAKDELGSFLSLGRCARRHEQYERSCSSDTALYQPEGLSRDTEQQTDTFLFATRNNRPRAARWPNSSTGTTCVGHMSKTDRLLGAWIRYNVNICSCPAFHQL
jgi:hypothetical protein